MQINLVSDAPTVFCLNLNKEEVESLKENAECVREIDKRKEKKRRYYVPRGLDKLFQGFCAYRSTDQDRDAYETESLTVDA